jgi:ArsR family transcriptional regulator
VDLVSIYQCFSDETRLRILNLLGEGPLCVCHFQDLLGEPQAKISKHLAYLRERGAVEVTRYQNWMIYQLPRKAPAELTANLVTLHDCARSRALFRRDLQKLRAMRKELSWLEGAIACCTPARKPKPKALPSP